MENKTLAYDAGNGVVGSLINKTFTLRKTRLWRLSYFAQLICHARRQRHLRVNEQRTDSALIQSIVAVAVRAARSKDSRPTLLRGIIATHSIPAGGGCRHEQRNGEMLDTTDAHSEGKCDLRRVALPPP
jgi:hypothetical protein